LLLSSAVNTSLAANLLSEQDLIVGISGYACVRPRHEQQPPAGSERRRYRPADLRS
jgi:hypothetical protein